MPAADHPPQSLREDAVAIWQAGVDAVRSDQLVRAAVQRHGDVLRICGQDQPLQGSGRIVVVGAGKAGAGMAAGFEAAIGEDLLVSEKVSGWINVPADCVRALRKIHLHAARPAGLNEPTAEGVHGTERILSLVSALTSDDLCIVLISGGGSALLPAPKLGVSLEEKQQVTRVLMRAGARIDELNCVRKRLSRIKGGGLARACGAGRIISLIISDVIGDPIDIIASGPTAPNRQTAAEALDVLRKYAGSRETIPASVWESLERPPLDEPCSSRFSWERVFNHIIGNNRTAVDAAAQEAARRGYEIVRQSFDEAGVARDVGRRLAEECLAIRSGMNEQGRPLCIICGGEPVVRVVATDRPQKGGRNQEVALAAACRWRHDPPAGMVLLSGGTDGEDGPTDAAGAIADADVIERARSQGLQPDEFLRWNNAYPFFDLAGGLLRTGPTHTNVMDLRVALIGPES